MGPTAAKALRRVRGWLGQGANDMWHGFPVAPEGKPFLTGLGRKGVTSIHDLTRWSRTAPAEVVPLEGLVATQPNVSVRDVAAYLENPDLKQERGFYGKSGALVDLPLVVRWDGTDYIHDGHHRLTAARLSGEDQATVRLLDLDARGCTLWAANRSKR